MYSKIVLTILGTASVIVLTQCDLSKKANDKESPKPELKNVTYQTHIKPIMDESCVGCHGGNGAAAGLNLETYEEVKQAVEQNHLLDRIHSENAPMPPGNLLPSLEQDVIDHWVENGYKKQ